MKTRIMVCVLAVVVAIVPVFAGENGITNLQAQCSDGSVTVSANTSDPNTFQISVIAPWGTINCCDQRANHGELVWAFGSSIAGFPESPGVYTFWIVEEHSRFKGTLAGQISCTIS